MRKAAPKPGLPEYGRTPTTAGPCTIARRSVCRTDHLRTALGHIKAPQALSQSKSKGADPLVLSGVYEDIEPDDPRLARLGDKWKRMGPDGECYGDYRNDRSAATMAFATACAAAGIADDVIASLLMTWEIGAHVREHSNVPYALKRTITKAKKHVAKNDTTVGLTDESGNGKLSNTDVAASAGADCLETYAEAAGKALTESGDPLVAGVIERGTFSTWYGPPKGGKTFIVLWLCLCIAAGIPWAGRKTRRGAVVYVALEGGKGIYKRLRALQIEHPELDGSALFIIRKKLDLLHGRTGIDFLVQQCARAAERSGLPVEAIVIDTVSRALSGGDENSPIDMGGFVGNADMLRDRTGAHVLTVHHTGKDKTKGMRGHSALLGAVDTGIEILDRKITSPDQRDLDDNLCLQFRLKPINIGATANGDDVRSCVADVRPNGEMPNEPQPLTGESQQFADALRAWLGAQYDKAPGEMPFKPRDAIKCAASVTPENVRVHSSNPSAFRTKVNRMLKEMNENGHVRQVSKGKWVFRNVQNVQNEQITPVIG